ncbi:hypothetical protein [Roseovarius pelagicus]|uniref:hypothetical protein n=1 Tax=Roseovarius pelagicus TaxID=2980108 RepID=UPI003570E44B
MLQPEIVTLMSDSSGAVAAVKNGIQLLPDDKRAAVELAFGEEEIKNIKWAARIQPGVEDLEGMALARIKAATGE